MLMKMKCPTSRNPTVKSFDPVYPSSSSFHCRSVQPSAVTKTNSDMQPALRESQSAVEWPFSAYSAEPKK